ncbi:ATP phosphoribosyltransferase regulatory subunit [Anthocerotibacter panamensis]|uniref:ATP phosphoribosyltransferase regulatory subunit n=1 Tax=Anthocerotibacter panamensis TaxID=2857077 RepID=UPI001C402C85|nr:ATP phosphoribosyltransferase regulatory subunit [Anthocerotibacter panamensis]
MDYLPSAYYLRQKVSRQLAEHFERYGYQGIELPILEDVDLHLRKTGQGVRRWLYRFQDRHDRELCLRPEITASVMRALLPDLDPSLLPLRLHYQGAVFRQNQEPQQMTQVGVELIGAAAGELAEAECIQMAFTGLKEDLRLDDLQLVMSDMGTVIQMAQRWIPDARYQDFVIESYSNLGRDLPTVEALTQRLGELGLLTPDDPLPASQKQLAELLSRLGADQSRVLLKGLLEVLQVPTEGSRDMEEMVQRLIAKLDRETHQTGVRHFVQAVQDLAQVQGPAPQALQQFAAFLSTYTLDLAPYHSLQTLLGYLTQGALPQDALSLDALSLDFSFGRTLHYYSGLIFEIRHRGVTLCGGGRYDGLLRSLGSAVECPAFGFSYNLEAICQALTADNPPPARTWQLPHFVQVLLCPESVADYGPTLHLAQQLRTNRLRVQVQAQFGYHPEESREALAVVVLVGQRATLYPPKGAAPQSLPVAALLPTLTALFS